MKVKLLKALPHIAAVILFAAISIAYFSPVLDGYTLKQGDIENFMGMSKEVRDFRDMTGEEALWTNAAFGGMPAYQISVIHTSNLLKHVDRLYSLYLPRPIDLMFIAMLGFYILLLCMRVNPWLAIPGAIAFGLGTVHVLYMGAGHVSKVKAIAYMAPVLGGMLLTLRGKLIAGAAVTALFVGLQLSANHLQMTYYLLFLLLFVGVAEAIRLIKEGQLNYLLKSAGVLAIAALLGVMPSMSNLLTTYEYSKYTTRGESELTITPNGDPRNDQVGLDKNYILDYSLARGEFWSMWIPDVKGGASGYIGNDRKLLGVVDKEFQEPISQQNRYWGEQRFAGGSFYFGAGVVLLFLLSLVFLKETALKIAGGLLVALCVLLSWKVPNGIGNFFLDSFPMYAQFRDTKMILVLAMIIMPFFGFLFLDRLIAEKEISLKKLLISSGAILAVLLLILTTPTSFFDFMSSAENEQFGEILSQDGIDSQQESYIYGIIDGLQEVRQEIFKADAIRSFIITLVAILLVLLLALKKIDRRVLIPALGLLMLIDLWGVNRRYLDAENVKRNPRWQEKWEYLHPFSPSSADMNILNIEQMSNPEVADRIAQAEDAVEAPSDRKNQKYKERLVNEAAFSTLGFATNFRVLNLGNPFNEAQTSYWHKSIGGYHGAKLKRFQEVVEFYVQKELAGFGENAQNTGVMQAFSEMKVLNMLNLKYLIYNPEQSPLANPFNNGNAWFAKEIKWVKDADEEMLSLGKSDLARTAIIDERFKEQIAEVAMVDSSAQIEMTAYAPNELKYKANSSTGGLAVFSEIHYPKGWQARIDGADVEHIRVNYLLRGLKIPAGEHEVSFHFMPASFQMGSMISLIGSLLVILLGMGALLQELRKKATEKA